MVAGSLHNMASLASLAKFMVPAVAGTTAFWFWYRKVYGWTRTMNQEWYEAEEKYMMAVPRQGSDKPIRINPFSDKISMHLNH